MRKKKALIFIGLTIIIALVTSGIIYTKLQQGLREAQALETPVAVAVDNLYLGTVLKKEMIKTAPFLKESLPEGYFSDPSSLEGRVVISSIRINEPIFESRLAPSDIKKGGVAAVINSSKRAMAVKVDKIIGVSGFIHPGDRVDVLVTLKNYDINSSATKTVLQNILVLAVGPEIEEDETKGKPSMVDVITLEVTPEEGEKLALAATAGKVLLSLRNPIDTESVETEGATIPVLLSSYNQVKQAKDSGVETRKSKTRKIVRKEKQTMSSHEKSTYKVDLIKGNKLDEITLERSK